MQLSQFEIHNKGGLVLEICVMPFVQALDFDSCLARPDLMGPLFVFSMFIVIQVNWNIFQEALSGAAAAGLGSLDFLRNNQQVWFLMWCKLLFPHYLFYLLDSIQTLHQNDRMCWIQFHFDHYFLSWYVWAYIFFNMILLVMCSRISSVESTVIGRD